MVTLNAHFDGKVIVPDEPLTLEPNQRLRVSIEPIESGPAKPQGKRTFVAQPGVFTFVAPCICLSRS